MALPVWVKSFAATSANHLPRDWSTWSHRKADASYSIDLVHSSVPGEPPALEFKSGKAIQEDSFVSAYTEFSPEQYLGKKFEFTAWIKTERVTDSAKLWAVSEDDNEVLTFDDMSNRSVRATSGWTKQSIVLSVPRQSKRLRIGFMLNGGGTVFFKCPSVQPARQDKPTTELPYHEAVFRLNSLNRTPKNLGFEDYGIRPDSLNHWATLDADGTPEKRQFEIKRATSEGSKLNGKPSICIAAVSREPKGFGSAYQTFAADNYRGKRVCFTGYIKTESVKDWSGLFMQVDSKDRVLAFDAMEDRTVKGNTNWKKYKIVLDVPPSSSRIKIGYLQAGTGKSWVSNMSFEPAGAGEAVTGKPVKDERFPSLHLLSKPPLDFGNEN